MYTFEHQSSSGIDLASECLLQVYLYHDGQLVAFMELTGVCRPPSERLAAPIHHHGHLDSLDSMHRQSNISTILAVNCHIPLSFKPKYLFIIIDHSSSIHPNYITVLEKTGESLSYDPQVKRVVQT